MNEFAESGAIAEAQALFIAGFPRGKTDGEFLQHFSHSLHIEGLIYQEHVSGQKRRNPVLPPSGEFDFHKPLMDLYGDLSILPNSICTTMKKGFAKDLEFVGEVVKASDETKFSYLYGDWILPYLQKCRRQH